MAMILSAPEPKKTVRVVTVDQPRSWASQRPQGPTTTYERALRGIAREVGKLIRGYTATDPLNPDVEVRLRHALTSYSELIGPWALHVVNNVFKSVNSQDDFAWRQHSKNMSVALQKELRQTDTGDVMRSLMQSNLQLIKSIPLQAAERVHRLVQANMMQSKRSSEIAKKIMETEGVTRSRATLIARTEVSKAQVALTQARAISIGSTGYIWRTVGDRIVRESHRGMNGQFVRWDQPVTLDNMTGHAGCFPNCRCYPEPVLPEG